MSNLNTTIVICCAGMGTRLGIGTTKALLDINGKPLILHQLEALRNFDDIRVVVGYQADKVIQVVNSCRKDIMFVFNNEYRTTGPAVSLSKGMINSREYVISIDGDVLVNPDDFQRILNLEGEYLTISERHSTEPILIEVQDNKANGFLRDSDFEWPGIAKIKSNRLKNASGYTYETIEGLLPIPTVLIRSRDIDTPEDYEDAISWIANGYK